MDIQLFDDARKTDLQNFQTQYTALKTQYSTTISAAIQEQNPASQNTLIEKVLATNKNLSEAIRGILTALNKGTAEIDTVTVDKLTADLIRYQKDYQTLKSSMDKLQTLKMIQATTSGNLSDAISAYNVYIIALCLLCLVVIMLAVRASWTTNIVEEVTGGVRRFARLL
jgi:hypothetical protein